VFAPRPQLARLPAPACTPGKDRCPSPRQPGPALAPVSRRCATPSPCPIQRGVWAPAAAPPSAAARALPSPPPLPQCSSSSSSCGRPAQLGPPCTRVPRPGARPQQSNPTSQQRAPRRAPGQPLAACPGAARQPAPSRKPCLWCVSCASSGGRRRGAGHIRPGPARATAPSGPFCGGPACRPTVTAFACTRTRPRLPLGPLKHNLLLPHALHEQRAPPLPPNCTQAGSLCLGGALEGRATSTPVPHHTFHSYHAHGNTSGCHVTGCHAPRPSTAVLWRGGRSGRRGRPREGTHAMAHEVQHPGALNSRGPAVIAAGCNKGQGTEVGKAGRLGSPAWRGVGRCRHLAAPAQALPATCESGGGGGGGAGRGAPAAALMHHPAGARGSRRARVMPGGPRRRSPRPPSPRPPRCLGRPRRHRPWRRHLLAAQDGCGQTAATGGGDTGGGRRRAGLGLRRGRRGRRAGEEGGGPARALRPNGCAPRGGQQPRASHAPG
jgi:hypothetical protein